LGRKLDNRSRLGLTGTHERILRVLRYVKLNHLCHNPLLDRMHLCGRRHRQLQVHEADHPQEIEKTEEEGGMLLVNLVKLAKIAILPVLGKGLAEFEVACTSSGTNRPWPHTPAGKSGAF